MNFKLFNFGSHDVSPEFVAIEMENDNHRPATFVELFQFSLSGGLLEKGFRPVIASGTIMKLRIGVFDSRFMPVLERDGRIDLTGAVGGPYCGCPYLGVPKEKL